jgi:ectoine hydroxylase-related dioxygenase (phytanoyl-CoA dioxygenase family)
MPSSGALSTQNVAFFRTFGFLKLAGLLRDDIADITAAFDEVVSDESQYRLETHEAVHGHRPRVTIPLIVERHPTLTALKHDPRIRGIATSLLGEKYRYDESDGNIFQCETDWHNDIYGATKGRHIKISLYLDPLTGESGALRFVPGTQFSDESLAKELRKALRGDGFEATFGVSRDQVPGWVVDTEPGDVLVGDYRTFHATFNSVAARRHLSMNFREWLPDEVEDVETAAALDTMRAALAPRAASSQPV